MKNILLLTIYLLCLQTLFPLFTPRGHTEAVTCISISKDDSLIVSAGEDKSIRVWNRKTGIQFKYFTGHKDSINAVAISSNNKFIASASSDGSVGIWSIKTGKLIKLCKERKNLENAVLTIAISDDDTYIVSGHADGTIVVRDSINGKVKHRFTDRHTKPIKHLFVCTLNGTDYIISSSPDNPLNVINKNNDDLSPGIIESPFITNISALAVHDKFLVCVANTDKKKMLVYLNMKNNWSYLSHKDLKVNNKKIKLDDTAKIINIGYNGTHTIFSDKENIIVYNPGAGKNAFTSYDNHTRNVTDIKMGNNGMFFVSASNDKTIRIWSLEDTIKQIANLSNNNHPVNAIAANNNFIVTGSDDDVIRLWDIKTGRLKTIFEGHTVSITSIIFSTDQHYIISGGADNTLRIRDIETKIEKAVFSDHHDTITCLAVSPDNVCFVSGSDDGWIKVRDHKTVLKKRLIKNTSICALAVDNTYVYAALNTGVITRYTRNALHDEIRYAVDNCGKINTLALFDNGRYLVAGGDDTVIRIWDITINKNPLITLKDHDAPITSLVISNNDHSLISGDDYGNIKVWDLETIIEEGDVQPDDVGNQIFNTAASINALSVTPDGEKIIVACGDSSVRIIKKSNTKLLATLYGFDGEQWIATQPDNQFCASSGEDIPGTWSGDREKKEVNNLPALKSLNTGDSICISDIMINGKKIESFDTSLDLTGDEISLTALITANDCEIDSVELLIDGKTEMTIVGASETMTLSETLRLPSKKNNVGIRINDSTNKHKIIKLPQLVISGYPGEIFVENFPVQVQPGDTLFINKNPIIVKSMGENESKITYLSDEVDKVMKIVKSGINWISDGVNNFLTFCEEKKLILKGFDTPYKNSHAVIVAIDDFSDLDGDFNQLPLMTENADKLKTNLINLGFEEKNIKTFYNADATSDGIKTYLERFWIGEEVKNKISGVDRLFIYFGGHGVYDEVIKGAFFVTYNYDPDSKLQTAIKLQELTNTHAKNIEAKHLLIALDCCFSGKIPIAMDNNTTEKDLTFPELAIIRNEVTKPARNFLLAASGDQKANYLPGQGAVFTLALNAALEGKANYINDGILQLEELSIFIRNNVALQLSLTNMAYEQHPTLHIHEEGYNKGRFLFLLPE